MDNPMAWVVGITIVLLLSAGVYLMVGGDMDTLNTAKDGALSSILGS